MKMERNENDLVFCVDFDGTLCEHKYPEIGKPIHEHIDLFKKLRKSGCQIILWTCRDGIYLHQAVEWCKQQGLEFDAVNEDLPIIKSFNKMPKSNKVYADYYFDDKNISLNQLKKILDAITYEGD